MKQKNSYPYNQHTAPESSAFMKICKETKELNLPKEYLLDLYIHVRSSRHNKAGTMTPFQPNVTATMEHNFPQYNKKLANIMTIMETIEPLVFMQNFDEYLSSGKYCNAVENGAIYEQFLTSAGKANRLIVIDPNPFMVEEICAIEDDALRNRFTLVFKESNYAKVYRSAEQLNGLRISLLSELSFAKDDNVRILYFARFEIKKQSKMEMQDVLWNDLTFMRKGLPNAKKWKLFCLIPTAMLENAKSTESLRMDVMELFSLEKIYLIDPKAVQVTGYRKLCLVTLSYMPKMEDVEDIHNRLAKHNILLQRCDYLDENLFQQTTRTSVSSGNVVDMECVEKSVAATRAMLVDRDAYSICANQLYTSEDTLLNTYESVKFSNYIPKDRERAKNYSISKEINLSYSGKFSADSATQHLIIYQGYVHRDNGKNYKLRKKELHYKKKKTCTSLNQLEECLESLVLDDSNLHSMIAKSIAAEYGKNPITMKTFCILHAKMLKEKKVDENIYKKVFATPKSADNPLCRILVGVASIEEIKKAVVETSKACNFKEGEEGDLWRQLYTIYGVAIDKEYMKENPILGIIKEMDKQDSEIKYFKKHMTEKTLTEAQEAAILAELLTKEEYGLVVGMLIKIFSGLTYSEICALTWKDYIKLTGYDCMLLNIHQFFEDKDTIPFQHIRERKRRIIPVTKFIVPMMKEWKKRTDKLFKHYKLEKSAADSKPIVYKLTDPLTPVTPDALRNFGNKLYKKHGPKGHILELANGKGGKDEYDTSSYGGDKFCENFYYQGLHEAGLDEGQLCYLLGIHAVGTFEDNYAGYAKWTQLVEMRDKLDIWAAKRLGNLNHLDRKKATFTVTAATKTVVTKPTVIPMEMTFEMKIKEDSPDIQIELFNRLGFDVYCEWK